jgi:AraC-like DNA-binding protein
MERLEIIFDESVQKIFDYFAESFEIVIIFYSADGRILRRGLNRSNSDFCSLIQKLYGPLKCTSMDKEKCDACLKEKKIINYQCHAGIEEAVGPIFIRGYLAGFVMIGQFRSENAISPAVLEDARQKGIEKELRKAFNKLPCYDHHKVKSILGLFSILTDYITAKEIVDIKGELLVNKAILFLKKNVNRNISLKELSRYCSRSPSSISHTFKKVLGKSFKQSQIEIKLEKAEDYLKNTPALSIEETAFKLGFNDPFYFSRLYKKYRGFPPSKLKLKRK